jgi:hypothetical protein
MRVATVVSQAPGIRWLPLRPGLGRAGRLLARIGGSWCQLLPWSHCPHQFDKTAHRNVRLTRRLTF